MCGQRALTRRYSMLLHSAHCHSSRIGWPSIPGELWYRRSACFPQALQISAGHLPPSFSSRAATRFSNSSTRSGAALTRFHTSQRSRAAIRSLRPINAQRP